MLALNIIKCSRVKLLGEQAALNCTVTHGMMPVMINDTLNNDLKIANKFFEDNVGSEHDSDNNLDDLAFMHHCQCV